MTFLLPLLLLTGLGPASGMEAGKPPAEYEKLEIVYTLEADQTLTERRSGQIQLFDTPALAEARRLVVPRLNSNDVVRVEQLVKVEPDGRESPISVGDATPSGRLLSWELPSLAPGDRVRFSVVQPVDVQRQSGQWWYSGRIVIPLPVVQGALTLRRPPDFAGSVAASRSRRTPLADGDSWALDGAKASSGSWRFTISSFRDWSSFGAWVDGLCDTSKGERLRELGESVSGEVSDPLEGALRLADQLSLRLRVLDANGPFRYSCRSVEETLGEGRATLLEAQAVLWALLTAQGFSAERLLSGPAEEDQRSVRPEGFRRAWVRVNGAGGTLWFDVAKLARASGISDGEAASALRISNKDAGWVTVSPNWDSLPPGTLVAKLDGFIDSLGLLQANLQISATGTLGRIYREAFGSKPEDVMNFLASFPSELQIVSRPVVANLENPELPFEVFVPLRQENFLPPFKRRPRFEFNVIPFLPKTHSLPGGRQWLGPPGIYREEISIQFPANFRVMTNQRRDDDRRYATYHSHATVADGALRIDRELKIRETPVKAPQAEVWQFQSAVAADQSNRFIAQRQGRALTEEWIRSIPAYLADSWGYKAFDDYEYDVTLKLDEIARSANPDGAYVWNNLAAVLQRVGRFDEAVDALQKQIARLPESRHAYVNLAIENTRTGDYEMALANFRKQLEVNPKNKTALSALPDILLRLGRWSEAEKASLEAAEKLGTPGFKTTAAAMRVCAATAPDARAWMAPALSMPNLGILDIAAYGLSACGKGLAVAQECVDRALTDPARFTVAEQELMSTSLDRQLQIGSFVWSQARILAWRGETEKAAEMLRDVVNLGLFRDSFADLAKLEWDLGRREEGLKRWREALSLMPGLQPLVPPEAASEIARMPAGLADGIWYPMEGLENPGESRGSGNSAVYYYVVANPDGTVRSARPVERADSGAKALIPALRKLLFPTFQVRDQPIPTVHLLKCVKREDGGMAWYHSASSMAAKIVSALAPEEFPRLAAEDEQ